MEIVLLERRLGTHRGRRHPRRSSRGTRTWTLSLGRAGTGVDPPLSSSINRPMAENNRRQAYLIEGAEALPNPHGTAPGQFVSVNGRLAFLLPGPPRELKAMMVEQVIPRLIPCLPAQIIKLRTFRIAGMGESDLDALIAPVYAKYSNPTTTVLSAPGRSISNSDRAMCNGRRSRCAAPRSRRSDRGNAGRSMSTQPDNEPLEVAVGNLLRRNRLPSRPQRAAPEADCRAIDRACRQFRLLCWQPCYVYRINKRNGLLGVTQELLQNLYSRE